MSLVSLSFSSPAEEQKNKLVKIFWISVGFRIRQTHETHRPLGQGSDHESVLNTIISENAVICERLGSRLMDRLVFWTERLVASPMHGASDHPAPPCKRLSTLHVPPHVSAFQLPKHFPMQGIYSSPCTSTPPHGPYFVADLWQVEARICVAGEGVLHSSGSEGQCQRQGPPQQRDTMKTFWDCTSTSSRELFSFSLGRPKNTIRVTAGTGEVGRHLHPRGRISYSRPFPGTLMFYLRLESLLLSLASSFRYCPSRYCCWDPSVVHTFQFISTKGEEAKDFDSRAQNDEASEPAFVRAHVARSLRM